MSVCLLKSSAVSIGAFKRETVRKAARLAVYDEMSMRVKNDHTQLIILIDGDLGFISVPEKQNQKCK